MVTTSAHSLLSNEPLHEKTNNLGFRPGLAQIDLYSHRREGYGYKYSCAPNECPQRQNLHTLYCISMFTRKIILPLLVSQFSLFWCLINKAFIQVYTCVLRLQLFKENLRIHTCLQVVGNVTIDVNGKMNFSRAKFSTV